MRAANEIPASEGPKPSTTMEEEQYTKACEELQRVDERIPKEIVERAVQLFFSTHLLPDYDLSSCYSIDLHSANMIALIMPLPETSKFQMPPPFGKSKNYTFGAWHYRHKCPTDPHRRKDQTGQLDLSSKSSTQQSSIFRRILPRKTGGQ